MCNFWIDVTTNVVSGLLGALIVIVLITYLKAWGVRSLLYEVESGIEALLGQMASKRICDHEAKSKIDDVKDHLVLAQHEAISDSERGLRLRRRRLLALKEILKELEELDVERLRYLAVRLAFSEPEVQEFTRSLEALRATIKHQRRTTFFWHFILP